MKRWRRFRNPCVHSSESWVFPADLKSYPLSKQCGSAWTSFCRKANHCGVHFRQKTDEALSRQSHLRLLATRARDGVCAIRLQSEPFLHRIRHLYATSSTRKTVPTMIVAAFAGLALILLLLKMGMSNQADNEHAGTVKGATPSLTQVPDWTIFDDAFAIQPTSPLASEFADRVRTSGATEMSDRADTSAASVERVGTSATSASETSLKESRFLDTAHRRYARTKVRPPEHESVQRSLSICSGFS